MNHTFKTGFTLAELLAVVIIVALMTSFSVGYYTKSKAQARFTEVVNQANANAEELNQTYIEAAMNGASIPETEAESAIVCEESQHYCVEVTTDFVTTVPKGRVACVGTDENGKGQAFCESVGYGRCSSGSITGHPSVSICTRGLPSAS